MKMLFFSWIGFAISDTYHPYMEQFDYDRDQFPDIFQLTVSGQPINISQQLLRLCQDKQIATLFLQDNQPMTFKKPHDPAYVDIEAGFNDYIFTLENEEDYLESYQDFHYFVSSDITNMSNK